MSAVNPDLTPDLIELPAELVDVRGAGCASVLIRLARLAKADSTPRNLTVWTDDEGAPEELPAWCRMTGHHFLGPVAGSTNRYCISLYPSLQE
jgi:tRNA 2-thiouridine synthesizing protein A